MELYRRIYKYFKYKKIGVSFYIILSLSVWIINLVMPKLIGNFIDNLLISKRITSVYNFTFFALILTMLSVSMSYILSILKTKIVNDTCNDFKSEISIGLWESDEYNLNNQDRGYLTQKIFSDVDTIVNYVINNISGIITNSFTLAFILLLVFKINTLIGIILIGIIPIYILLYFLFRKEIFKYAINFKDKSTEYFGLFNKLIENTYFLKINGAFRVGIDIIKENYTTLKKSAVDYAKKIYFFSSLGSILSSFSQLLIILIGGINIIKGNMTIGEFTIVSAYLNMFIGSIRYFLELSKNYQDSKASYKRIMLLESIPKINLGDTKIDKVSEISLENISFAYDGKKIINNLNFSISEPGIYRIIGKNGKGKTT